MFSKRISAWAEKSTYPAQTTVFLKNPKTTTNKTHTPKNPKENRIINSEATWTQNNQDFMLTTEG